MGVVGVFVTHSWERDSGVSHQAGLSGSGMGAVGDFVTFAWERSIRVFLIKRGYQEAA